MLLHGAEGSGASLATIVLAAEEVRAEQPVVFLCRWPMAVKRLQDELELSKKPDVAAPSLRAEVAIPLSESRLVTMHGNSAFLLRSFRALPHWNERIVIIKNCEETLSPDLWAAVQDHPRVVISGDIIQTAVDLSGHPWQMMSAFSVPPAWWSFPNTPWPKYIGRSKHRERFREMMVVEA